MQNLRPAGTSSLLEGYSVIPYRECVSEVGADETVIEMSNEEKSTLSRAGGEFWLGSVLLFPSSTDFACVAVMRVGNWEIMLGS